MAHVRQPRPDSGLGFLVKRRGNNLQDCNRFYLSAKAGFWPLLPYSLDSGVLTPLPPKSSRAEPPGAARAGARGRESRGLGPRVNQPDPTRPNFGKAWFPYPKLWETLNPKPRGGGSRRLGPRVLPQPRTTSLIRNSPPLGPYSKTMPRTLWWT